MGVPSCNTAVHTQITLERWYFKMTLKQSILIIVGKTFNPNTREAKTDGSLGV